MSWARVAIFWVCILSIVFNLSLGIINTAFPDFTNHASYSGGLQYNGTYSDTFTVQNQINITPETDLTQASNGFSFIGFMNKLQLGFIVTFITSIKSYMFGIIDFSDTLTAGYMENKALHDMLFTGLYMLMGIIYILGCWMLITGRDVMGDN